jgi:chromosome segregation ATPase
MEDEKQMISGIKNQVEELEKRIHEAKSETAENREKRRKMEVEFEQIKERNARLETEVAKCRDRRDFYCRPFNLSERDKMELVQRYNAELYEQRAALDKQIDELEDVNMKNEIPKAEVRALKTEAREREIKNQTLRQALQVIAK